MISDLFIQQILYFNNQRRREISWSYVGGMKATGEAIEKHDHEKVSASLISNSTLL